LFISSTHQNKKRLAPDAARSMGKKRCQKNGKTGWPEIGDVGGEAAARVTTNAACRAGRPIYGRTALKR
jgi:hypothetical protein